MLGVERIEAVADRGFCDSFEIKECVDNGVVPYVARSKFNPGLGRKGVPAAEFSLDKFVYDRDADVYVCPEGQRLEFWSPTVADGKNMRVYKSKIGACFSCRFFMTKCTRSKIERTVYRWVHEAVMDEMKQRLRIYPEKMDARKRLVEHPFGSMKRAFNQGYLLLKGLRKVGCEVGFSVMAYNMRRVLNILGSKILVDLLVARF